MSPFDTLLLAATVRLATPLLFAATGELVAERSGVINVGLEGMMLGGAFFSFWTVSATGSLFLGVLAGAAAGAAFGAVMAVFSLWLRGDQIVVGIGINIVALGLTGALFDELFVGSSTVRVEKFHALPIPLLSDIPVIGPALFRQTALGYLIFLLLPIVIFVLHRTTWGLSIRAAGEAPAAVDAAGLNVTAIRSGATMFAGAMAGIGGAFLSIGQLGLFIGGMSGGRGFLALAAVVFGRWRPLPMVAACFVFGGAEALQLRLQAESFVPSAIWLVTGLLLLGFVLERVFRGGARISTSTVLSSVLATALIALAFFEPSWSLPSELWLALPPVLALVALVSLRGNVRAPSMLGVPYLRDAEASV